ncbi:MAG: GNAT family protein [Rhizobiaceae bacterium]
MLALPFLRRDLPSLTGRRVTMRLPQRCDYEQWSSLRRESRSFLVPWEPEWGRDELGRPAWRQRLARSLDDHRRGAAIGFFIFACDDRRLLGGITLGNIRYGVARSGHIGYWIGERFAGQGYMSEALDLLSAYAFDRLALHRIEAACIPDNARSIRVLEKAGFQREGLLRSYLKINGIWQDHLLYALIVDDWRKRTAKD